VLWALLIGSLLALGWIFTLLVDVTFHNFMLRHDRFAYQSMHPVRYGAILGGLFLSGMTALISIAALIATKED